MNYDGTSFVMRDTAGTFDPRTGGSGITAGQHKVLDQLVHELAETSYVELTRVSGKVTEVIAWTDNGKTVKIRETLITRSGNQVSTVVEKQYDGAGSLVETLTHTFTYSSGRVASIDTVAT